MEKKQTFLAVKITSNGWSITARSNADSTYQPSALSQASAFIPPASGTMIAGSITRLAGSDRITIRSIDATEDGFMLTLEDAEENIGAAIKLTGRTAKRLPLSIGENINIMPVSNGHLLVASGQAIALIPSQDNLARIADRFSNQYN